MQRITFAQVGNWVVAAVMFIGWGLNRLSDAVIFGCQLVLISIALFCYCCVMRKLPMQLQEEELLVEYRKGVDFGRKDTLEKLAALGHAFKTTPDGSVSIIPQAAELGATPNKTLAS